MDRMPPASSMSMRSLPGNMVFPKIVSSGSTEREDSNAQRSSSSPSSRTSAAADALRASRSSRCSRRSRAAANNASSAAPRGTRVVGTGAGFRWSSTLTKTRCELSVWARSPEATFSAKTCTPTSIEHRPIASTWARRTAISPTLTGWRKSMSSMAPRRQWPRATRAAAMFPTVAIHCIMRPPWICQGAPACSGNTHWTISVTVSLIDSMGRCRTGVNPSFIYHATRSKSSHGNAGLRLARRRRRRRRRTLDPRTVEPMEAARVEPEISHLGARHRPVQARVERNPGNLLGKKCLGSAVNAQPLRPEGDLAATDQQIVEPAVPVEREVARRRSPHRAFARRERVEQHVGIPTIGLGLGEGQIWQASLHRLERGLRRERLDVHRDGRGTEHAANGFRHAPYLGAGTGIRRKRGRHPLTYARFAEESLRHGGITEGEWNQVGRRPDPARQEESREAGRRLDSSRNA